MLTAFHLSPEASFAGPGTMWRCDVPVRASGRPPRSFLYRVTVPYVGDDGLTTPVASQRGVKTSMRLGAVGSANEQSLSPPP